MKNEKKVIRSFIKDKDLVKQRRRQIFLGAAKLFLKNGYGGTSMQELADSLGMSKVGLYHYIGGKEDIIHLIAEYSGEYERNTLKQLTQSSSAAQTLSDAIKLYITGVDENQDIHLFNNHVIAGLTPEYRHRMFEDYRFIVNSFKEIIEKGIQTGEFKEVDAGLVAHNLMLAMQAWALKRWLLRNDFTLAEYIKRQTELTIKSLKNDNKES
ncbi:MAG: TetR/AcrR family transcriptional regulator [Dehalococcoidales bacterium]|nr:TetR/AcrR family transcriptional regulator [Dehalococcoidales bacterium]